MPLVLARAGLLLALLLGALPGVACAASTAQHAMSSVVHVQALYAGPQGIVLAGTPPPGKPSSAYDTITASPTFTIKPGPSGDPAGAIWAGPDGNPWYLSAEDRPAGTSEAFPTLVDLTPGGPVVSVKDPISSAATGGRQIAAVVADGGTWIANTAGKIEKAAAGTVTQVPLTVAADSATSIAATADGNVWVTDEVRGSIDQLTPSGETIEHRYPSDGFGEFGNSEPGDIAVGPDGALWFTEENAGVIGRLTEGGSYQAFAIPNPSGLPAGFQGVPAPRSIVAGPDGAMWFTDPGDEAIGRVTPSGEVTEFPVISKTPATPDLIVSYGGELWFSEGGAAALGSVNPAGPTAVPVPEKSAPVKDAAVSTGRITGVLRVAHLSARRPRAAGLSIVVRRHGQAVKVFRTQSDGAFSVSLPPGVYSLRGPAPACRSKPVMVRASKTAHLSLVCRAARYRRVRTTTGISREVLFW